MSVNTTTLIIKDAPLQKRNKVTVPIKRRVVIAYLCVSVLEKSLFWGISVC